MDTLHTALQPFWDYINIARGAFILVFIGMGVYSAFYGEALIKFLVAIGSVFFIASSLSNIAPGLTIQIPPYFGALGIGLIVGSIVKWVASRIIQ